MCKCYTLGLKLCYIIQFLSAVLNLSQTRNGKTSKFTSLLLLLKSVCCYILICVVCVYKKKFKWKTKYNNSIHTLIKSSK